MWISSTVRNGPPEVFANCIMRRRLQSLYLILPMYLFMDVLLLVKLSLVADLQKSGWIGWLMVTGLLLAILSRDPASARVRPEVRAFLDDDLTRANRQTAQQTGFWVAIALCGLLLAARLVVPLSVPQVGLGIVSGAVLSAALHYFLLERTALHG